MSNLISATQLCSRLGEPDLRIVDVRASLTDHDAGHRLYSENHLPGAVFLSLEDDLSGPKGTKGGRHPLPDMFAFASTLQTHGVGDGAKVVVYDDSSGMFAARLWWLLRYAGFDDAQVLDGGYSAWTAAGLPVTQELPRAEPRPLTLHLRPQLTASMGEILAKLGDSRVKLFDARAPERYRGEHEPLDQKAGHIPGAINKPFAGNLEDGRFKSPEALKARFAEAKDADEIILYCGSGVSAAHNALALEEAHIEGARLYVGSWSDWSSVDENPVATGDESGK